MVKKLLSAYWFFFKRVWREPWFYIILLSQPLLTGELSVRRPILTALLLVLFFPIIAIIISLAKQKSNKPREGKS